MGSDRRGWWLGLTLATVLVAGACSSDGGAGSDGTGPATSGAGNTDLPDEAAGLMAAEKYRSSRWSLIVEAADGGDPVYALDSGKIGTMGSNAKLYTVGTWLDVFGPDHTIETPVYGLGSVSGGRLDGDLVLRAMGDLVMGSRQAGSGKLAYSVPPQGDANGIPGAKPAPGDPLAGLNDLAEQVAASGVTEVGGDVLIDDRLFQQWETPRPLEISPIVVNDNLLAMVTTPGSAGEPGTVETVPETAAFTIVNDTETVAAGEDTTLSFAPELDAQGNPTNVIAVNGTIATDAEPVLNVYEVPDPATYARTLFIEALERAGVTVSTDPLAVNDASTLPGAESYAAGNAPLGTIESPPISEIATLVWKISHNYGADLAVCLLAVNEGSTDCDDGFGPVRERIGDLGIDQSDVWILDGSGSSVASTTPDAMATWLRWLHSRQWSDRLPEMLPILGTDGSLSLSETDSPAKGRVQAKTGTWAARDPGTGDLLMLDQSLAGFMQGGDGTVYVFALYRHNTSFESLSDILGSLDNVAAVAAALQQSL
ncbi:D-alanyl-D-alanine carboxypeptidase/D-alanyl-D-alanine-endopeptidase [Mycobacterium sp. Y57]|uniref:D-alanyl-D-alanine carboxypeptidase/D-alanyl-D-alanine endopeptidase n=1 Tax=Mycolicibacterium xanthum TaxID=2796469 RepID=UPI001C8624C6|nr:D-alanyl-D-alanine carboxypeptidase/D-alanyl-D-alanine-endopeptidase [Mycolicibacterium xanthum]MBX7433749.1 D-alanyl-D-alanine carboxypeptidase/D-alanyl-D-alanine-endopeptidase [Mycolicibacterium xanthum]